MCQWGADGRSLIIYIHIPDSWIIAICIERPQPLPFKAECPVQYYDRTEKIVGQIRKVLLETDVTAGDNLGDLEDFKRDAAAYGEAPVHVVKTAALHGRQGRWRP